MAKKQMKARKEVAGPPVRAETRVVGRKNADEAEPEAKPTEKGGE